MAAFFEAAKPIAVDGGIKARSQRGKIGEQWWSRHFIEILEGICDPGRLARGRAYARKGQVLSLSVAPGTVTAAVQGSRPAPYKVDITIERYDESRWDAISAALASQALYRAKLLAGEMPTEIVEVFDELGAPLFPAELDMECSCPDWGFPCKHLSAALYLLAEAFDDDPFLVLAWRGRTREELLGSLGTAPVVADPLRVDHVPLAGALAGFYAPGASPAKLREHGTNRVAAPPDLLLRALDPPDVRIRHIPLVDLLRSAYRSLGGSDMPAGTGT
ncbi:putative Zn finger protein [Catenuloplanes nepalensis]|uniref:Zn finger protein n=1 Tax=Catenuloplanes nepalensis TaxID=587533 RepID=A0ABT9N579_9ACTN|nr:SWIM zinc finger family protein [Catenuloplanes nepalensis]MDP9798862.1 putative Zn finger protein [Catenuloplanes nepalensis]